MLNKLIKDIKKATESACEFVSNSKEAQTNSGYVGKLIINIPKKELASRNLTRNDMSFYQLNNDVVSEDFEYIAKLIKAIESVK